MTQTEASTYPVDLTVDYPDGERSRLTALVRPLLALPFVIMLSLLTGVGGGGSIGEDSTSWTLGSSVGGALMVPVLLSLLFCQRYPRWWFDWHVGFSGYAARVTAYLLLLRDEVPALEEEQAVRVRLDRPDAAGLSRWMPLVKWLLVLPHVLILAVLLVAAAVCTVIAWLAILLTGRYPRGLFDFVVGVLRWVLRVEAYALLLLTDRYPPFSLDP
jgi:hypothetical protein